MFEVLMYGLVIIAAVIVTAPRKRMPADQSCLPAPVPPTIAARKAKLRQNKEFLFQVMTPSLYPLLSPAEQGMVRNHFWELADTLPNADEWLEILTA